MNLHIISILQNTKVFGFFEILKLFCNFQKFRNVFTSAPVKVVTTETFKLLNLDDKLCKRFQTFA